MLTPRQQRRRLGRGLQVGAAVDRRARRVDDAAGAGIARRHQNRQRAVRVGGVGRERLLDGPEHGAVGGLMEDDLDPVGRLADGGLVTHVTLDEFGVRVDVVAESGAEVVEHTNGVAPGDQFVDQVRPDEPAAARHENLHERGSVPGYVRRG